MISLLGRAVIAVGLSSNVLMTLNGFIHRDNIVQHKRSILRVVQVGTGDK